jgi:phospholipase C
MAITFINRNSRPSAALAWLLVALMSISIPASSQESRSDAADQKTATPIKHVIVIIGENHTFDNIYGTYEPKHGTVWNLLSRGIVHSDGSPGPNAGLATQFQLQTINPPSYFIDTRKLINPGKTAYSPFLPTPEAGFAPPLPVTLTQFLNDPAGTVAPFDAKTFSTAELHTISPALEFGALDLLTTGATGLQLHSRPDAAAIVLLRAGHAHREFQPAAQHVVPDHRRQRAL